MSSTKTDLDRDREEVMRLHTGWLDANRQRSIEMMRSVFVGGDKFIGVNINGYIYRGIEEWAKLWTGFMPTVTTLGVTESDLILYVKGDMAWTAYQGTITVAGLPRAATGLYEEQYDESKPMTAAWHGTEIFMREDEHGNPVWKMWRYHGSPALPGRSPGLDF
ncbi:MAG TPA: nuclear transport factor 2 family protein [Blastocatellia bacterium]|nr:nuclear transport factor 2 family protein [Blastocatellia bacterium]